MGTITPRKRKDKSVGYTARIRINREGRTVYQESQIYERKQMAQAWLKRRETELPKYEGKRGAKPFMNKTRIWICSRSLQDF